MSNGGPHGDKWYALQVSVTSDPNAQSSSQVLIQLNAYPVGGATTVVCSDGTFVFVGYYKK